MRTAVKRLVLAIAAIAIAPMFVSFRVRALVLGRNRALEGSTQTLALVPGIPGQYLRRAFLAIVLEECDASATIEFGTIFSQCGTRIGPNAYVGPRCHIGLAHIERDVLIGPGVHVPSGGATHDFSTLALPIHEQPHHRSHVRIGAGAWIGSAAVVMADVGRDTVVGAGAVVTRPLPEAVIAGGVPARVIRSRVGTSAIA
jgi:virginiamycin A acetyltransferase